MRAVIDIELLTRVFSDAHIKDVDFSEWDEAVTLCVLADHYREWEGGRCPILLISFCRVSDFRVHFTHLGIEPLKDGKHIQWLVDQSTFKPNGDEWTVALTSSLTAAPTLELRCETVLVQELDHRDLDRACPNWDKPNRGLARAGIAALVAARRGKAST